VDAAVGGAVGQVLSVVAVVLTDRLIADSPV
jgi:hypothetical protein